MKVLVSLRSRARLIAVALLPAMLLRVLTPVGFMPMHDAHGDVYFAFCPGIGDTMLPPAATDDPHRGHHAMHDHAAPDHAAPDHGAAQHGGDAPVPGHHNVCPYALSAGPALAYAVPEVPVRAAPIAPGPPPTYLSVSLPTIDRAQSARAPPAPRIA